MISYTTKTVRKNCAIFSKKTGPQNVKCVFFRIEYISDLGIKMSSWNMLQSPRKVIKMLQKCQKQTFCIFLIQVSF